VASRAGRRRLSLIGSELDPSLVCCVLACATVCGYHNKQRDTAVCSRASKYHGERGIDTAYVLLQKAARRASSSLSLVMSLPEQLRRAAQF